MRSFEIYEKHLTNDFECYIDEADTSPPEPNQISVEIPYMNGSYDFSDLLGNATYPDRTLTYYIDMIEDSSVKLNMKKIVLENWLLGKPRGILKDNAIPGYYYLAKCISIKENNDEVYSRLEIKFKAYPFKICEYEEGNLLWDTFNFELDIFQDTKFDIKETKQVKLYNYSATNINPTIICSSDMTILKNNITYTLKAGTTKDYRFFLDRGENDFTIKGNGTIEFKFRKELL